MPKLLVSVRDAAEARAALQGGADLIDVKEPDRGPLGAADAATIDAVVAEAQPVLTSAALGELGEGRSLAGVAHAPDFAKFGLAGCAADDAWPLRWQRAILELPARTKPVAVGYADWSAAAAPPPAEIVAAARELSCAAILIDTHDKQAGTLLDCWTLDEIAQLLSAAREAQMLAVVAGGLTASDLARVAPLGPDYVGVRGAACRGGRSGMLDAVLVARLAGTLANTRSHASRPEKSGYRIRPR